MLLRGTDGRPVWAYSVVNFDDKATSAVFIACSKASADESLERVPGDR